MNAPTRLGLFGLALAVVFALAAVTARAVVPEETARSWAQESTTHGGEHASPSDDGTGDADDEHSAHDGAAAPAGLSLEQDGGIRCESSITDQGQGTGTALTQIVAEELGVEPDAIEVQSGDTATAPMGGGAWASRGTSLGGEAALRAARKLKQNILSIAASMLQADASALRLEKGSILNSAGLAQMSVADVAGAAFYRSQMVPMAELPPLEITESFVPRATPYICANGIHAAHVEVDTDLGTIRILDYWVVEDCGRVVNPLLVDEQIRGGVVQGIGSALYEQCIYSSEGQLENGSLMDYLVPMAGEMPDIRIAHVETPTPVTTLGARGVGEAGTIAAGAAIWTAVNDALSPLGAVVSSQPITPEHVLDSIDRARRS